MGRQEAEAAREFMIAEDAKEAEDKDLYRIDYRVTLNVSIDVPAYGPETAREDAETRITDLIQRFGADHDVKVHSSKPLRTGAWKNITD